MSGSRNSSSGAAHYVWEYEYYDDDEPVSFEGLRAHRYSIVIGFWVGLAVFVIFMFFVLTLLTKTGSPHQENPDPYEKAHRHTSCAVDISNPQDLENLACSRPRLDESRSLIHCFLQEEQQAGAGLGSGKANTGNECNLRDCSGFLLQEAQKGQRSMQDASVLTHFDIPNFVNLENSFTLGDDDLLLCEPPITLDSKSHTYSNHHINS
ncbi:melanocortin-2 receptor accessory protein 2A-like [Scleropages formosus]|uniref:melanocortin-2 receptor accessory protein 2A-like n=1 Tax=Scleropages formosus TaxID=113540 RepID=UPI0008788475|nr:melanocortin-2 receptor accessory protein 2A-like [Scleropages formosus]